MQAYARRSCNPILPTTDVAFFPSFVTSHLYALSSAPPRVCGGVGGFFFFFFFSFPLFPSLLHRLTMRRMLGPSNENVHWLLTFLPEWAEV